MNHQRFDIRSWTPEAPGSLAELGYVGGGSVAHASWPSLTHILAGRYQHCCPSPSALVDTMPLNDVLKLV